MIINRDKLRNAREKKELSQAGLAERCKIAGGKQFVAALESGRRTMVRADTLYQLAKGLEVPMESLLMKDPA